jgi:trehalose/maltose hydrolase-like predicted phosphorylase
MRLRDDKMHFNPFIPDGWKSYSFRLNFRECHLEFKMNKKTDPDFQPLQNEYRFGGAWATLSFAC